MLNVMIVEDEKVIRLSLKKVIECEAGDAFRIAGEAKDGRTALDMLKVASPHIIITDIRMPVMDGLCFIEQLNKQNRSTEIVILSGYDDFTYAKQAMRLGVSDYLLKPVDPEELLQTLQRIRGRFEQANVHVINQIQWLREEKKRAQLMAEAVLASDCGKIAELVGSFREQSVRDAAAQASVKDLYDAYAVLLEEELRLKKELSWLAADSRMEFAHDGAHNASVLQTYLFGLIEEVKVRRNWAAGLLAKRAAQYIGKHYARVDLKLQDVADDLGISAFYLSRMFKAETGQNFIVYLTEYRLSEAKRLMGDPEAKLHAIAQQVGYEEYAHFSRVFKKYCGLSPMDYRRMTGVSASV